MVNHLRRSHNSPTEWSLSVLFINSSGLRVFLHVLHIDGLNVAVVDFAG